MKELISLFSAVNLPSSTQPSGPFAQKVMGLNRKAGFYGYTLDHRVLGALNTLLATNSKQFDQFHADFEDALIYITGNDMRYYRALYNKFPYETPDQQQYLADRMQVFGYGANGYIPNNPFKMLSCGHCIDLTKFDLNDFSACPVCQFQVDELVGSDNVRYKFSSITPLKVITLITTRGMGDKASEMMARPSSLSQAEKSFLISVVDDSEIAQHVTVPTGPVFKETLPFIYDFFGVDVTRQFVNGATDVMRIAAYLSDQSADLSLAANTKFKIGGSNQKKLLSLLEDLPNLTEDLMRDRERWLRLGEVLHPNSAKNQKKFPKVAKAFDDVRNNHKAVITFNKTVEKGLRSQAVTPMMLNTLASRPGEFARRIDSLLRISENTEGTAQPVVDVFRGKVVGKLNTKMLYDLSKYINSRDVLPDGKRMFIPKGKSNRMKLIPDNRLPVSVNAISQISSCLSDEQIVRAAAKPALGKVYIGPELQGLVMPFNKRGDSESNVAIPKGSKIQFHTRGNQLKYLRLFCHWIGDFDVDLSLVGYDENFDVKTEISFRNLKEGAFVHSGDIQNAPDGASEFIDIDITKVKKQKIRYITGSLISYRGQGFNTFPCFMGFMERDSLRSGEKYEPESVNLRFNINAETSSVIPIIFDLQENQMIVVDFEHGNGRYQTVGGNEKIKAMTKAVLAMPQTKVTAYDIISRHVQARGTIVSNPSDADLVYSIDNWQGAIEDAERMIS